MGTPETKLSISDFAKKVREKHPDYGDMDDDALTDKVLRKYPDYRQAVDVPDFDAPVTSKWGARRSYGGHTGADIGYQPGERVGAPRKGKVISARQVDGYGNRVEVDHGNGYTTTYSHLDAFDVNEGDEIGEGQSIGRVGNTGRSKGAHLHYEVLDNGRKINPLESIYRPRRVTDGAAQTPQAAPHIEAPTAAPLPPPNRQRGTATELEAPPTYSRPTGYLSEEDEAKALAEAAPQAPLRPRIAPPDLSTQAGRAQRDARETAERAPGARHVVPVTPGASPEEAMREVTTRLAAQSKSGITPEFAERWIREQGVIDARTGERLSVVPSERLAVSAEDVRRMERDYRASLSLPSRAVSNVSEVLSNVSPGEVLTGVGEGVVDTAKQGLEAARPVTEPAGRLMSAVDAAAWARAMGMSPAEAAVAVAQGPQARPDIYNPVGEVAGKVLDPINERAGKAARVVGGMIAQPSNLIPLAGGRMAGQVVSRAASGEGRLARAANELRDAGLYTPDVPDEAFKAVDDPRVLGDLTRRIDTTGAPLPDVPVAPLGARVQPELNKRPVPDVPVVSPEAPRVVKRIRHANPLIDGGEVIGRTADGKLKVKNNEGGVSVVKNPRTQGNRDAAIVRGGQDATTETTQAGVAQAVEPAPPAGTVRLYRGQGALGPGSGSRDKSDAGRWFTDNRALAEDYAEAARTGEKAEPLLYVDVPAAEAERMLRRSGPDKPNEYVLEDEYLAKATSTVPRKPEPTENAPQAKPAQPGPVVEPAPEAAAKGSSDDVRASRAYWEKQGVKVNPDDTVTMYHGTSADRAGQIENEGVINPGTGKNVIDTIPNSVWMTPNREYAEAFGRGGKVIEVRVPVTEVRNTPSQPNDFYTTKPVVRDSEGVWRTSPGEETYHNRLARKHYERGQAKAAPPEAKPTAPKRPTLTRDTLKESFKKSFNLDESRAEGVTTIVDARARAWAKEAPGRKAEDYIPTRIAGVVKGGEVGSGALYQEASLPIPEGVNSDSMRNKNARSPEFQRFFQNSKVVDKNGDPLIVYHGTNADISEFSGRHADPDASYGRAVYLTDNPKAASKYATNHPDRSIVSQGANVMPLFVSIKNPFTESAHVSVNGLREAVVKAAGDWSYVERGLKDIGFDASSETVPAKAVDYALRWGWQPWKGAEIVQKTLKNLGYDGVIYKPAKSLKESGRHIVAFEPGQVKSAIGNRGTFDPSDPNILFQGAQEARIISQQGQKAATEFLKDGRAILRGFQKADVSSAVHEFAHVFRRDISPELLRDAESAIGVKDGKWTTADEEKFARGFERYLKTGEAPSTKLRAVFESFKGWLTEIYGAVRGKAHPLGFKPNRELTAVFDRALGGAPKGEHGQVIHHLYKSGDAGVKPFFANDSVRAALGLKAIPADASTSDISAAMTETASKLAETQGRTRTSQMHPEFLARWSRQNKIDESGLKALRYATDEAKKGEVKAPEAVKPERAPTRYEQTGIRKRNIDPTKQSLSEFVRASGGIRVDRDRANAGELRALTNRESGTSGLVNNKTGVSLEDMARMAAEAGYPVGSGGEYVAEGARLRSNAEIGDADPDAFLNLLDSDVRGDKTYSSQREVDYEELYRRENPEDNTDALDSLLSSDRGGTLYDKVSDGTATRKETEEFRRVAEEFGVFPEHIQALVREGKAKKAEGVPGTAGDEAATDFDFRDDPLDDDSKFLFQRNHPEQLGFVNEGLTQESARPSAQKPQFDTARTETAKKALGSDYARLTALKDSPVARIASEVERRVTSANAQNAPDVVAALSKLAELKRAKTPVDDYLNQGSLFGGRELTPAQERILQTLDRSPRKVLDEAFSAEAQPTQDVLFQSADTGDRRARAYRALLRAKQPDLFDEMGRLKDKPRKATFGEKLGDLANAPRSLKSSIDLSASMRQGAMFTLTHPGPAARIFFGKQLRSLSNKGYEKFVGELKADPELKKMKDSGLHLTSLGDETIGNREEAFASKLAGKVPLVQRSEHAYVTFLDAARSQWFKQLAGQAEDAARKAGRTVTPDEYKTVAKFINRATGRGDLGKGIVNDAAPLLNSIFFAPRYAVSKVQIFDPRMYAKLPPGARRVALRQATQYFATIAGTALLLKEGFGLEVGTDPEDSDFLKLKIGNTRYDLAAGQGQYVTLAARLFRNFENRRAGKKDEFGKGAWENLDRFTRYKYAPVPAAIRNVAEGKNAIGRPADAKSESLELVTPIFLKDLFEAYQKEGAGGVARTSPAFVGIGVNTYERKSGGRPSRESSRPRRREREAER